MKRLIFFILFICTVFILQGRSMVPILNKSEGLVDYLENELNLEIVRMEYDILKTTKTTSRVLSSGWTYSIVAFGDYRFKDIDISVYKRVNGSWSLVERDQDSSEIALVVITPEYTEEYLIEIKAYSFNDGYEVGHYGLIVAHE